MTLRTARLPAADAASDAAVGALLDACPTSFAQQTTAWREAITRAGPDAPAFVGCWSGVRLVGVLPAYRFEGPLGAILTSVPQAGPLGGVAAAPDVEPGPVYAALLAAFLAVARATGCRLATVITNPLWPDRARYEAVRPADFVLENVCQVLDLATALDADGRLVECTTNVRRNLARAESGALAIDEEQSPANVDAWYAIHARRHGEIGATPLPRALFDAALDHVVPAGKGRFVFVRHATSGEMLGGGFYLHHGQVMDALMPSIATAGAALGTAYLLAAHTMRIARARGVGWYNWQPSPPDGGVYRFKRQWGSRDHVYAYLTWATGDPSPFLESTVAEIASAYRWHYVLPFDRIGTRLVAGAADSSRRAAWAAREGHRG